MSAPRCCVKMPTQLKRRKRMRSPSAPVCLPARKHGKVLKETHLELHPPWGSVFRLCASYADRFGHRRGHLSGPPFDLIMHASAARVAPLVVPMELAVAILGAKLPAKP